MSWIDYDIERFYDSMVTLRLEMEDYKKWIQNYLSFRDKYPDWITKGGQHIMLKDLTDSHLNNLILFVKRKDPENKTNWIKILEQEKTYRELKFKLNKAKEELGYMEEVKEKVF